MFSMPIALQRAQIIGVTQLAAQLLEDLQIAAAGLGAELALR